MRYNLRGFSLNVREGLTLNSFLGLICTLLVCLLHPALNLRVFALEKYIYTYFGFLEGSFLR